MVFLAFAKGLCINNDLMFFVNRGNPVMSFLPAATIEPRQVSMSHTKFVFRIRKGVYRLHEDALLAHV